MKDTVSSNKTSALPEASGTIDRPASGLKMQSLLSSSAAALPTLRPRCTTTTDETSSDGAFSRVSSDNGQQYQVLEYDMEQDAALEPSELFAEVVGKTAVISIDADSPAAAALRANAQIHVSSVGKAARAVQLQSVRRVLKRATGITKSGNKKGKPPRIPPTLLSSNVVVTGPIDLDAALGMEEEEEEEEEPESTTHSDGFHHMGDPMHLLDDSSVSQGGGGEMDESRNSLASQNVIKPSVGVPDKVVDRETMHIPDGVAPGTVEAGKKGICFSGLTCFAGFLLLLLTVVVVLATFYDSASICGSLRFAASGSMEKKKDRSSQEEEILCQGQSD